MQRFSTLLAALAFTLVFGHLTDKTTGQPLTDVTVQARSSSTTQTTLTDRNGHFRFQKLPPGNYTLMLSSKDVPPQSFHIEIGSDAQTINVKACSTTLDYSCVPGDGGGGA
ncbi:MAG TPA: DUF2012 domain-containing protein [Candidatus Baltobacteraceae bacterium]|jgi:hypothetical protein